MIKPLILAATMGASAATASFADGHGSDLKSAALGAFGALFDDHSEDGVRAYFAPDIVQHNPFVPTGRDALIGLLPVLEASGIAWTNHRILQDGDFVVLHNSFTNAQAFGASEIVTIDIYQMEDGKVAAHWDAIQPFVTETVSGRSMVDGPTKITDLEQTEANKALAVALVEDVLMGKDPAKITEYISAESYAQHNPAIADGLDGIIAAVEEFTAQGNMFVYTDIHAVFGEGNFVLTVSEGEWSGQTHAFYDLFRMESGMIVEHWDVIQPVPTEGLANTNGMFNGFEGAGPDTVGQ
ncbi:MAG: nuclear transport factor 2 family protein [Pseudomonadota bacterium]